MLSNLSKRAFANQHLSKFATIDPSAQKIGTGMNLVNGKWESSSKTHDLIDPLNGKVMHTQPDLQMDEGQDYINFLKNTPKYGLHNPFLKKERYLMLGEVTSKAVEVLSDKDVFEFFVKSIQRCSPKSHAGAYGELKVTHDFLKNFSGDNVRFLAESFKSPGDYEGQFTTSYRWPYGGVGLITPFNFPIEIPVLQWLGALYMGNAPLVKPCYRVGFPMEQWIRLFHYCGLPMEDSSFFYANNG
jgi:1-pyrroline-5-carboxylate dehydrogenase